MEFVLCSSHQACYLLYYLYEITGNNGIHIYLSVYVIPENLRPNSPLGEWINDDVIVVSDLNKILAD